MLLPTVDELSPLTIDEIRDVQRRDADLTRVRRYIETASAATTTELEGDPAAIRT